MLRPPSPVTVAGSPRVAATIRPLTTSKRCSAPWTNCSTNTPSPSSKAKGNTASISSLRDEVGKNAAPVVAVQRFEHYRGADFTGRSPSVGRIGDRPAAGNGNAGRLQQPLGQLLVLRNILAHHRGSIGFGGENPPLPSAVAKLHETAGIQPHERDAARLGRPDDRPRARSQAHVLRHGPQLPQLDGKTALLTAGGCRAKLDRGGQAGSAQGLFGELQRQLRRSVRGQGLRAVKEQSAPANAWSSNATPATSSAPSMPAPSRCKKATSRAGRSPRVTGRENQSIRRRSRAAICGGGRPASSPGRTHVSSTGKGPQTLGPCSAKILNSSIVPSIVTKSCPVSKRGLAVTSRSVPWPGRRLHERPRSCRGAIGSVRERLPWRPGPILPRP